MFLAESVGRDSFCQGVMVEIEVIGWDKYNPRKDLKSMPWFRLESDIGYSSKLFGVEPDGRWLWIFILSTCARAMNGRIDANLKYFSHMTAISEVKIKKHIQVFENIGLVRIANGCDRVTNGFVPNRTEQNEQNITDATERSPTSDELAQRVILYLNEKLGSKYGPSAKSNTKFITSRLKENDYTFSDFKRVIDVKHQEWCNDPKMVKYLRPKTLFNENFESYLNQEPEELNDFDIFSNALNSGELNVQG